MFIAICDDSAIDREIVSILLKEYASKNNCHFDLIEYSSGKQLIYDIEDGYIFNIIILDIYMESHLGIDVARKLRDEMNYGGKILFITSTSEFAVDSYDVEACGYLIKPLNRDKVFSVIDKIVSTYQKDTYQIRQHAGIIHIPFDEILYVESNNNKCTFYCLKEKNYTIYKKLDEIENEIPNANFLRCHQSYLVNMDYVKSADKSFELVTGDFVNIRQRDLKAIRDAYFDYLSNKKDRSKI